MNVIKQIISLLMIAIAITVACYFLPFFNDLFEDYIVGFYIAAVVLPIGLAMYKAHMASLEELPPNVRVKRERECDKWSKEFRRSTFSPTHDHELGNFHRDDR